MSPQVGRVVAGVALLTGVLALGLCGRSEPETRPARTADNPDRGVPAGPKGQLHGQVTDDNGAPVPDAQVSLEPAPRGVSVMASVTDQEGRFVLPRGYRNDPQALESESPPDIIVRSPGYATTAVPLLGIQDPLVIPIDATATLRGQLILPPDAPGLDLAQAKLAIAGSGIWPARQLAVDAAGRFEAAELPEGLYELSARLGPLYARPHDAVLLAPGHTSEVALNLTRGAVMIVLVLDRESGEPLADVQVTVAEDALGFQPLLLETDHRGIARAEGLRPAPHRVSLRRNAYVRLTGQTATPGGEVQRFQLSAAGTLRGRVVDARGSPVAGAQLEVRGVSDDGAPLSLSGATDGNGIEAPLSGPPAGLPAGRSEGLGVTRGPIPKVPLEPTGAIAANDHPAASDTMEGASGLTTDIRGRFEIRDVPAGNLKVFARTSNLAPGVSEAFSTRAGQLVADLEIMLANPGELLVSVATADGAPAAGVPLELQRAAEVLPRMGITDGDGRYRFTRVAGLCTVVARPPGQAAARGQANVDEAQPGELAIRILSTGERLQGRVLDSRRRPVSFARVRIAPAAKSVGKPDTPLVVLTAEDGTFEAIGLPGPPYEVTVNASDHGRLRMTVDAADSPVNITLTPGRIVRVALTDANTGDPIDGVRASLLGTSGPYGAQAHSGKMEFSDVTPGNYELNIQDRRFILKRLDVTVDPDPRNEEELSVELTQLGTAAGDVIDRLGSPVTGARVTPVAATDGGPEAITDEDGQFTLPGLTPGPVRLTAHHPTAGEDTTGAPIRIRSGETAPGVLIRLPDVARAIETPEPRELAESQEATGARRTGDRAGNDPADGEGPSPALADRMFTLPGLSLTSGQRGVVIGEVDSAVAAAGVQVGDHLVSVDGERVLSAAQARSMLRGPTGTRTRLRLRRAGKTHQVALARP